MTLLNDIRILAGDNDTQPVLTDAELQRTLELLVVTGTGDSRRINLLSGAIAYLRAVETFRPDNNPKRVAAAAERRAYLEKIFNSEERRDEFDRDYDLTPGPDPAPSGGGQGVTQANAYPVLKQVLVEGTNITLTADDTEEEIEISASGMVSASDSVARAAAAKVAADLLTETQNRQARDAERVTTDTYNAGQNSQDTRITALEGRHPLPDFPPAGQRDNKVAKFNGDNLGWEEDGGGTTDQTARDAAAAAQGAADRAATAAGNANSAAAKVAQDLVSETTARTSADSALDARVKTLEGGGSSVGIESILLPAKSSGGADRRATVTVTWTLAEIRTVESTFAEPEGDYILAATLSDQREFTVEHVEWDDTNSELDVVLRNVNGGTRADTYTGRVTLNVLRGAEGGGGTGDVTTAQLEAEAKARSDGDDLQVETVGTAQRYTDVVALQANSAQPLRMIISADIQVTVRQGVTQALSEGEILEFAPRSTTPEPYLTVNLNWRNDLTHVSDTASTEAEWNAKTAAHATVHNNLWLRVTKRLFSTISGARRAREVGELYHVPPRSTIATFIVDTTSKEEADAIVNNSIANGVALWARGPGQNIDAQNNRAYPLPGDLAPTPQKDYALFNNGNRNEWRAVPSGGVPADGSITTVKIADRAVTGDKIATRTIANGNLNQELQVQQVQLLIDPDRDALTGKYDITVVNSTAVRGGFVQVELNGRVVGGRVAWTQQTTFSVTPTTADITAMSLVSTTQVSVALGFYSDASAGQGDFYGSPQTFTYVRPKSTGGGGRTAVKVFDNMAGSTIGTVDTTARSGRPPTSVITAWTAGTFTISDVKQDEIFDLVVRHSVISDILPQRSNYSHFFGFSHTLIRDHVNGEIIGNNQFFAGESGLAETDQIEAYKVSYFSHKAGSREFPVVFWTNNGDFTLNPSGRTIGQISRCEVWLIRG